MNSLAGYQRLTIHPRQIQGQQVQLTPAQSHYLGRVLRLSAGDAFIAMDGQGHWWRAQLLTPTTAQLGEPLPIWRELPAPIALLMGIPKGDGMDQVVRQATELGGAADLAIDHRTDAGASQCCSDGALAADCYGSGRTVMAAMDTRGIPGPTFGHSRNAGEGHAQVGVRPGTGIPASDHRTAPRTNGFSGTDWARGGLESGRNGLVAGSGSAGGVFGEKGTTHGHRTSRCSGTNWGIMGRVPLAGCTHDHNLRLRVGCVGCIQQFRRPPAGTQDMQESAGRTLSGNLLGQDGHVNSSRGAYCITNSGIPVGTG